jgi:hypothetical protein
MRDHWPVEERLRPRRSRFYEPGQRSELGRNDETFSDHTDLRPTLMTLLGLTDDYVHDGRVLVEKLDPHVLPRSLRGGFEEEREGFAELARVYKQLNAPLGALGKSSLALATRAINGSDADYSSYLAWIAKLTTQRDAPCAQDQDRARRGGVQGRAPRRADGRAIGAPRPRAHQDDRGALISRPRLSRSRSRICVSA